MGPSDGGWGWAVVFGCFLIHLIMDGLFYSFGVFYTEFLEYFESDKSTTSLIGSLLNGMYTFAGPLASVLINRYGTRTIAVVGALITSSGFILSVFAPNIYWLCITFGVIPGIGDALMYVAAIVSVGYYFEQKRSFAMGLAVCGTGIGTFVFAPLTKYLIDQYTWKGAVLIEAGLMLNCVVAGALFRPLLQTETATSANVQHENSKASVIKHEDNIQYSHITDKCASTLLGKSDGFLYEKTQSLLKSNSPSSPNLDKYSSNSRTFANSDLFLHITKSRISMHCNNVSSKQQIDSVYSNFRTRCSHWKELLGLSLFKDISFLLFVISTCFTSFGTILPYIYLPDRANESGLSKAKSAFLISAAGISNTIARVTFGWIAARTISNPSYIFGTGILICGLSTLLSPLDDSNTFLLCYAVVFGGCAGIYICLSSIVLVEFVGIEKLSSSFGLMLLLRGVVSLLGVPAAGYLFDVTGNYNVTFYLAGVIIMLSGILLFISYAVKQRRQRANDNVIDNVNSD